MKADVEISDAVELIAPLDILTIEDRCVLVVGADMIPYSGFVAGKKYTWEVFDGSDLDMTAPKKVAQFRELKTFLEINLARGMEISHLLLKDNPMEKRSFENEKMLAARQKITRKIIKQQYSLYCNDTYMSYLPWGCGNEVWPLHRVNGVEQTFSTIPSAYPEDNSSAIFRDFSRQFIMDIYQKLGLVKQWPRDDATRDIILCRVIRKVNNIVPDSLPIDELQSGEDEEDYDEFSMAPVRPTEELWDKRSQRH